jgi:hypothetical protein
MQNKQRALGWERELLPEMLWTASIMVEEWPDLAWRPWGDDFKRHDHDTHDRHGALLSPRPRPPRKVAYKAARSLEVRPPQRRSPRGLPGAGVRRSGDGGN